MVGLITYLGSSPRRILTVLVISAAAVAAFQFAPLFQRAAGTQEVGAQQVISENTDNPRFARLFESRPIPGRTAIPQPSTPTPVPGVQGNPGEEPVVPGVEEDVAEIPVSIPVTPQAGSSHTVENLVLRPTSAWVNVFGETATLNGRPVSAGDVITAFDPDGTLIGRTVVTREGRYGLMALYMDDPATSVDEGAEPGDVISFKINGIPALALGPHSPVWTDNGAILSTNLAAAG